jgi:hypothetical protein
VTMDFLMAFLLRCLIFNYAVLIIWFVALIVAEKWMFALHSRWFPMPNNDFARAHYMLMGMYKIGVLIFNLAPYIALKLLV